MLQRLAQSRLSAAVVAALVAGALAGGITSAVAVTKADPTTITMCVSALGTKIRFVHTAADCSSGELVRTWNIEGPEGDRGRRGLRGATGPSGPSGPTGAAGATGASGSIYDGGYGVDAAQSVGFYVASTATQTPVVLATTTFLVPAGTHAYKVQALTPTVTPPAASAACTGPATASADPSFQLVLNSTNIASGTAASNLAFDNILSLPAGNNVLVMQVTPGKCSAGLTSTTAHLADVTNRRMVALYGG